MKEPEVQYEEEGQGRAAAVGMWFGSGDDDGHRKGGMETTEILAQI